MRFPQPTLSVPCRAARCHQRTYVAFPTTLLFLSLSTNSAHPPCCVPVHFWRPHLAHRCVGTTETKKASRTPGLSNDVFSFRTFFLFVLGLLSPTISRIVSPGERRHRRHRAPSSYPLRPGTFAFPMSSATSFSVLERRRKCMYAVCCPIDFVPTLCCPPKSVQTYYVKSESPSPPLRGTPLLFPFGAMFRITHTHTSSSPSARQDVRDARRGEGRGEG